MWPSMNINKRDCLNRAKELLDSKAHNCVHYAALELRLCIEAMAYEQLTSYRAHIPPTVLETVWQPPQLLKILRQLDPLADQELELSIGPPFVEGNKPAESEYRSVGKYTPLGYRWLQKHYNKLGSCLHVGGVLLADEASATAYLHEVIADIETAQSGTILSIATIRPISFRCPACNEMSSASEHYVREVRGIVACLTPNCGAQFIATVDGEEVMFQHRAGRLPCPTCKTPLIIEMRYREDGREFKCASCTSAWILQSRWGLAPKAVP